MLGKVWLFQVFAKKNSPFVLTLPADAKYLTT